MNIPTLNTQRTDLSQGGIENLASRPDVSDPDKIAEVARQFEAYLLRQYLGEAKKCQIGKPLVPEDGTSRIYQDMVLQQTADTMSKAGTFGLGNALREQLIRQNVGPAADAVATPPEKVHS